MEAAAKFIVVFISFYVPFYPLYFLSSYYVDRHVRNKLDDENECMAGNSCTEYFDIFLRRKNPSIFVNVTAKKISGTFLCGHGVNGGFERIGHYTHLAFKIFIQKTHLF